MPIDNSPKKSQLEVLEEIRDASGGGGICPLTGTSPFDCRAYINW